MGVLCRRHGYVHGKEAEELLVAPRSNPNGIKPDPRVLNRQGRIKPHQYETPHDEPSNTGPCWFCILPKDHPVHRVSRPSK